ncbi:MAG: class I SAM-dependent rRNA methyltransferase [Planctomycetes bacterium]|nr:class I SAM-dependent rRNA methyltransferase [Planctomycetota bacterium]
MSSPRPVITLRVPGSRGHLFYYRKMVLKPDARIEPGELVDVVDNRGGFVGTGFFNPRSEIAVRLLSTARDDSADFLTRRLREAVAFRHELLKLPASTDAYRLCHAEGDGLTGLVVDRFGSVVVAQLFSRGWFRRLDEVKRALGAVASGAAVHAIADEKAASFEGFTLPPAPPPAPVVVTENGAKFRVNFATGHKTGFFCDQRDNRRLVGELARGRAALDLCCYTGGFAVHAALGGARNVTAVDLDEDALETGKRNAKLNGVSVDFRHADVFDFLRALPETPSHDLVVLDPAKLARNRLELGKARRAYHDMNALAFRAVARGGVFVTCSCSGLVGEAEFLEIVREAARQAGREYRVFRVAGAGADHPVSTLFPEGRYLKAVFGTVI